MWLLLMRYRRIACTAVSVVIAAVAVPVAVVVLVVAGPPPATAPAAADAIGRPVATGALVSVREVTVDSSLEEQLRALLLAADAEEVPLGGSGHRSAAAQIDLRRAHCGTSYYAVFQMPADECMPPTARPGQSMHERGLAIDFTCGGRLVTGHDRCFRWLADHAAEFRLFNLPSEPWHWSVNGR